MHKGKLFRDWCALDVEDTRKIVYENVTDDNGNKITSDDYVTPAQMMWISTEAVIQRLKLIDNVWHVWLV